MFNIVLISTEHREFGNCNSDELCKILESINPDVIFEEEPNDDSYHSSYSEKDSFKSLEVQAIIKYRQYHEVLHIPVDKEISQYLPFSAWEYMFEKFKQNDDYNQIIKEHCSLRNQKGFPYLNSEKCFELFEQMILNQENIISTNNLDMERLSRIYNLFQ